MKSRNIVVFFTLFMTATQAEARWPLFSAPDLIFLEKNGYFETQDCPYGTKRLKKKIIPMASLCSTYCDPNWYWEALEPNECIKIEQDFGFTYSEVVEILDKKGRVKALSLWAHYGDSRETPPLLTLEFRLPPHSFWTCMPTEKEGSIFTCANDV